MAGRCSRYYRNLNGEQDTTNASDFFIRRLGIDSILEHHENFIDLIDNGNFNPYKPYQLCEYYIENGTFQELDLIHKFIHGNVKRNIALVGEKGAGKTALQNVWLSKSNKKLESENVFWVRCDGHKLYQLWLGWQARLEARGENHDGDFGNLVGIDKYLSVQLLYVIAKYSDPERSTLLNREANGRQFLPKILEKIKNQKISFNMPISNVPGHTEKRNLYEVIVDYRKIIQLNETSKDPRYSYAYDNVMRISLEANQKNLRKWVATSQALEDFMLSNEYKILKVVDGVDNVHINEDRSQKLYTYMIDEASIFLKKRPRDGITHLEVLRERTYIDVCKYPIQQDVRQDYINTHKITLQQNSFKSIIRERHKYAEKNLWDSQGLYGKIAEEVLSCLPSRAYSNQHHNNLREFLHNKASLILMVCYRIHQLGNKDVKKTEIKSIVTLLEKRNKFLNGRLYLNTLDQWTDLNSEMGLCSMNPFFINFEDYKNINKDKREWPILCKTRILQLLSVNNKINERDLVKYLEKHFRYTPYLIESSLRDLRAFGMIDSGKRETIFHEISNKGKDHLLNIFTDLDSLYYFGLDTCLPSSLSSENLLAAHNNKLKKKSLFPSSSLITSITFISFLSFVSKSEEEYFKLSISNEKNNSDIHFPSLKLPFADDGNFENIKEQVNKIFNVPDKQDISEINKFLKNWKKFTDV